jgi:ribosomal protein L29
MTKPEDLRVQSEEELIALEQEKRKEIFQFRNAIANNDKEAKPHFIQQRKKDIARILTIRTQRRNQATEGK